MARQGHAELRRMRMGRGQAGAALVLCLALAGCASGESLDGVFGAQDTGVATGNTGGVNNTPGRLAVGSGPNAVEYECPQLTVRTGAAAWQVTERDGGLRYQGSIGQLARECSIAGQTMAVKVGIQGRVLLGEKGKPGKFQVPIRVAVVEEGPSPTTITTKFFVVPLEIPEGQNSADFTVVEDQISYPLLKPAQMDRYVIYVGFDPQGEPKARTTSRPSKPSKPRTTSSQPKPSAPAASTSAPSASSAPPAFSAPPSSSSDPGAPSSDVFGPPPSASTTSGAPSSGGFAPPPSTSTSSGGFSEPAQLR